MKMDLIQPFINAADAVLAENLQCSTRIADVSMDEEAYRKKGLAAMVLIRGDIEGRVIFDMASPVALTMARVLAGCEVGEDDAMVREAVCEMANQVIGNAVTSLNDQGFRFKIFPPEFHTSPEGLQGGTDTEALVMCFETCAGPVYMNIAMHYNLRRRGERITAGA